MKPWYASKVLWFNVLSAVVLIASTFGFADFQPSAETEDIATFVILGVNLVLRFFTKVPLR